MATHDMADKRSFIVATPGRSVCDDNARSLHRHGLLRFVALGLRRGIPQIPAEYTRLRPSFQLATYASAMTLSKFQAESFRFRLHPWFDRWVKKQLQQGDSIISSYGYTNESFRWVRQHGGKTFLDGGNSHPDNFWTILAEEHARWNCPYPPVAKHHYKRALEMMPDVDYVLSPSTYVTRSFLTRGFKPDQIIRNVYPLDLSCFYPPKEPRPANRPLTLIAPGSLSLRKGTPYLLEALRLVVKKIPQARLILNSMVFDNVAPVVKKNADLPIDWKPASMPHPQLAETLRGSDLLILPSLEDGFARTVAEALACDVPVITTPNTGASDLIVPGKNGEIVPIRDSGAIADAVFKWADMILSPAGRPKISFDSSALSFDNFDKDFIGQLQQKGLA